MTSPPSDKATLYEQLITTFSEGLREKNEPQSARNLSFDEWLYVVSPKFPWHYRHLEYVREALAKVTTGEINKLMVFMPPRHYKTQTVTIRYTAWRMERDPTLRVITAAYNQTLAEKFSRQIRRIAEGRIPLTRRRAVHDWETVEGGGLRAVGVGAGVTGVGGKLIVIDDPVKSREEAESDSYRDRVYEWYTDDLYTRQEPGCQLILIQTRWHTDDLAGRILSSEDGPNWTVVSLPAEADEADDPLGRAMGEPLCPDLFDLEALQDIHRTMGNSYYALYQQRPQPKAGYTFQREWFRPSDTQAPDPAQRVRFWDLAASLKGDYTVGVRMARTQAGQYYIEDVVRGQWTPFERNAIILDTAQRDGPRCYIGIEEEPGSAGKSVSADLTRMLAGFVVRTERPTGDKYVRALPFATQCEAGNVLMVRAGWNAEYISELCSFPTGKHDDQVDPSAAGFSMLAGMVTRAFTPHVAGSRGIISSYKPR